MKKKPILIVVGVILGVALLFGMKMYVDSYTSDSGKTEAGNKEDNKGTDEQGSSEGANKANKDENNKNDDKEDSEKGYNQDSNFTLTDMEGNEVSLSDYEGKKVFVNFWATWCPYCVDEMPDIQKLHEEVDPEEIVVLTVNVGENKETIEKFIEGKDFTFPILQDSDLSVSSQYGASALPMTVLIDRDGEPIHVARGMLTYEQMTEFIKGEIKDYK